MVAFVNIGCYYLVGLPLAAVFGFKLKLNAAVRQGWMLLRNMVIFLEGTSLILYAVAGDLGGGVDWNGATDCDSVCDPLQNQMAERGIVV